MMMKMGIITKRTGNKKKKLAIEIYYFYYNVAACKIKKIKY